MNPQDLQQSIEIIKQELGPGSEWILEVYVRQAYVNATLSLLWLIPAFLLFFISYRTHKAMMLVKPPKNSVDDDTVFVYLFLMIGVAFLTFPATRWIQVLLNPEYQAIKLMVETLK